MKTVTLQYGTNSFLKFERKPNDVFEQYKQLVKLCREKFNPDRFYLMTVIPMKNTSANMAKNRMYDEFNDLIKTYYENDPDINILGFNKMIKDIGAKTYSICHEIDLTDYENSEYKKLYHDNVHLNYRIGIPFLKNHANSKRHFRWSNLENPRNISYLCQYDKHIHLQHFKL